MKLNKLKKIVQEIVLLDQNETKDRDKNGDQKIK